MFVKNLVNFTQILPNLIKCLFMIHRSIYSFESVFLNRKKGKVMKAFPLNMLKLDYDHRERKVKTFALMIKLWACKTTSVQI